MTNDEAVALFETAGALLSGHFRLSSGLHSPRYLEKFRLVEEPRLLEPLCEELAGRFAGDGVECVLGPTTAGIILAYNLARMLDVSARYAERMEGAGRGLRRGQILAPGTRVLVVDDVMTTGGAVVECARIVERHGACLVGIGVLADRSGGTIPLPARLEAVLSVAVPAYSPDVCPLCAAGMLISQPGTSAGSRE